MKRILTILFFIFCFASSFGQVLSTNTPGTVGRSSKVVTSEDWNLAARANFLVPRFSDTTQANTNQFGGLDTSGRLIYTYDVDGYWYRSYVGGKHWSRFTNGGSTVILPSCGIGTNGLVPTGYTTYDSTSGGFAVFDVKGGPYALCCDKVARLLRDTVIAIPAPIDPDSPAYVGIFLNRSGVQIVIGTPASNPELPQSPDTCALLLTYVQFAGGQSQPTFVSSNNPLIIYDENYSTEWHVDSIRNMTADTANTNFPAHLSHSLHISNYTSFNSIEFKTNTPIDLNSYGALKLYIKRTSAASEIFLISFYLDNVQQTFPVQVITPNGGGNLYANYVIPLTSLLQVGTSTLVNQMRINITPISGADVYIDWIQLQSGIPIVNTTAGGGSVTSVGMGDLDSLLHPTTTNSTTTPFTNFTKFSVPPYTVLTNPYNVTGPYEWNKIDLSTPTVKGLLPIINVAPSTSDGDFVQTVGGVSSWVTVPTDTIYVEGPVLKLFPTGNGSDTLKARLIAGTGITFDTSVNGLTINASFVSQPTLQQVFNTEVGGSVLTKNDTILNRGNQLFILGSGGFGQLFISDTSFGYALQVEQTGGGGGIRSISGGTAITGTGTTVGVGGSSSNIAGLFSGQTNTSAIALDVSINPSDASTIKKIIEIDRNTTGTASNGIGSSIDFLIAHDGGFASLSNQIISVWSDAAQATRTSQFLIRGTSNAITNDIFELDGDGTATVTRSLGIGTTPGSDVIFDANDGSQDLISVNKTSFTTTVQANDGTATAGVTFTADLAGSGVVFVGFGADDGTHSAGLTIDAPTQQISFTALNGVVFSNTAQLGQYTVATLPAGTQGMIAYVTDALTPTFLTIVVGGGSVVTPVFFDGTNWVAF